MKKLVDGVLVEMSPEEEAALLASVTVVPSPAMVKAEAQRRIIALTGATDMQSCIVKQLNANMRATKINDIRLTRELTTAEQSEADGLRQLADMIEHIRARSNDVEAMNPIPTNYTDDSYWA